MKAKEIDILTLGQIEDAAKGCNATIQSLNPQDIEIRGLWTVFSSEDATNVFEVSSLDGLNKMIAVLKHSVILEYLPRKIKVAGNAVHHVFRKRGDLTVIHLLFHTENHALAA